MSSIEKIELHDNISRIGNEPSAFSECSSLEEIEYKQRKKWKQAEHFEYHYH